MSKEYVISGHSDETTDTFIIPYNISLVFYANLGETCMVPHNKESLDLVVNSMKYGQFELYSQGDSVQNYHVTFNQKQYEGIALIQQQTNSNNGLNYDFLQLQEGINSLKDICNFIHKKNNRANTLIYCVFCRGSKMEFEDYNFGEFNEEDIDKYLSNQDFNDNDFYDLLSENMDIDTTNSNLNVVQNSVGGRRKQKKQTNKRKKKKNNTNKKNNKTTRRNKYIKIT